MPYQLLSTSSRSLTNTDVPTSFVYLFRVFTWGLVYCFCQWLWIVDRSYILNILHFSLLPFHCNSFPFWEVNTKPGVLLCAVWWPEVVLYHVIFFFNVYSGVNQVPYQILKEPPRRKQKCMVVFVNLCGSTLAAAQVFIHCLSLFSPPPMKCWWWIFKNEKICSHSKIKYKCVVKPKGVAFSKDRGEAKYRFHTDKLLLHFFFWIICMCL